MGAKKEKERTGEVEEEVVKKALNKSLRELLGCLCFGLGGN